MVQPSTYGTDNRCTLAAIAALGDGARGIAVVDQTVTDAELERLDQGGIRGIRFHMLPAARCPGHPRAMAARVGNFGWHVQLQLDGRLLPDREALLKQLTGTLVVDHVGKFLEPVPVDHRRFKVLLRLLENGRTWVKLSAPYEWSKAGPPNYSDVGAARHRALPRGARPHAVGDQLAAPDARHCQAGRRLDARHDARMGARRGDAPQGAG